jgi:hypothetical protein
MHQTSRDSVLGRPSHQCTRLCLYAISTFLTVISVPASSPSISYRNEFLLYTHYPPSREARLGSKSPYGPYLHETVFQQSARPSRGLRISNLEGGQPTSRRRWLTLLDARPNSQSPPPWPKHTTQDSMDVIGPVSTF